MTPRAEQILYTAGMLPLAAAALIRLRGKLDTDKRGASFGVLNGMLAGLGQVAFYAALGLGPASVVTALSGIFPLVTVVLAMIFLRERINLVQAGGVALALVAITLLSS
jgi:transporter family protein